MCGIIGIASQTLIVDRSWLSAGRDAIAHRGPDDAGEWWSNDNRVGLGHRRLAIIDLSPAGHQPMCDALDELCIVFNGEIYNYHDLQRELLGKDHHFRSQSDTEVLLAAYREWGTECLSHLNGMFAFALYDKRRKRLFMARDRAGEKPLFYRIDHGELRFASELKGLLVDPKFSRQIDVAALDCYLAMGFVPGGRCIVQGVNKLPPGHALTFNLDTLKTTRWCYWKLPEPDIQGQPNETALIDELEELLEDAVRLQLAADVPVGILLSGGVDSSLVTAMAVRAASQVKTFTIRFPGYGKYDETEHARLIARHFGTEHIELESAESTVDLLQMLARELDEPVADSSVIPTYLVSRMIREYCTVALGGDGGDELFGGYVHYNRLLWRQQKLGWVPHSLRRLVATAAGDLLPIGFKGRSWLQGMTDEPTGPTLGSAPYFDFRARRSLVSKQGSWAREAGGSCAPKILQTTDLLQQATRMDFENYLAEDILVKVDRASMLNSLEIRAPLLDYRLIEFAFGRVPSCLKATSSHRKILLKKLTERLLPPDFDKHRKQGFSIPLASWLKTASWRGFFGDVLMSSQNTIFSRKVAADLLTGQMKGRANSERLFALVLFELWRREYGLTL